MFLCCRTKLKKIQKKNCAIISAISVVCLIDGPFFFHTENPTHIETRTHDQSGDTIEKSKAPDDGCIKVRNMFSI